MRSATWRAKILSRMVIGLRSKGHGRNARRKILPRALPGVLGNIAKFLGSFPKAAYGPRCDGDHARIIDQSCIQENDGIEKRPAFRATPGCCRNRAASLHGAFAALELWKQHP